MFSEVGKFSEEHLRRPAVGGVGIFGGIEGAKGDRRAPPPVFGFIRSLVWRFSAAVAVIISCVLGFRGRPQISPSVIRVVAVYVVNIFLWPFSGHVEPRKSVRLNSVTENLHDPIAVMPFVGIYGVSRERPSLPNRDFVSPYKGSGFRVVKDVLKQGFMRQWSFGNVSALSREGGWLSIKKCSDQGVFTVLPSIYVGATMPSRGNPTNSVACNGPSTSRGLPKKTFSFIVITKEFLESFLSNERCSRSLCHVWSS